MSNGPHQVQLLSEEIRMLIEILKYALDYCPIEGVSYEITMTKDEVQNLVAKLEKTLAYQ